MSEGGIVVARRRSGANDEIVVVPLREKESRVRGPWDHSGSINVAVDVDRLLAPPRRAMIVLRG